MEQSISKIKAQLCDIRLDRTRYVTASDVLRLYQEFQNDLVGASPEDLHKCKELLNETILLFSLSFITVGYTRHITSQYARAVTLRMLFMFLIVDPAFTHKELQVLKSSMDRLVDATEGAEDNSVPVIPIIKEQYFKLLKEIQEWYDKVAAVLAQLPESDYGLHNQVIHLRRDILAEVISPHFREENIEVLGAKLTKISQHAEISPIVEYQIRKAQTVIEWFGSGISKEAIKAESEELLPIFETLRKTLTDTDVFVMTRRWTMRCSDLYERMASLLKMEPLLLKNAECPSRLSQPIGPIRVDPSHKYWYLCTYVARRSWASIFRLLDTTEPVSEALQNVYNQLSTLKRCLVEVQEAGISNMRELYPYQMKLDSIDRMRVDGKFVVNGEIPPGQGLINGMLAQCYDLILEIEVELNDKYGDDTDHEDDESFIDGDNYSRTPSRRGSPVHEDHDDDHLADVPDATE